MDSKKRLGKWFGKSPKVARVGVAFTFLCAVLFAIIGWVNQAQASGTWYVKVGGNDASDCATPATACATINGALGKAGFVAGDTIKVSVGTFTGTGNEVVLIEKDVTLSGGWDAGFASQTGRTTVDGQDVRRGIYVSIGTATIDRFIIEKGFADLQGGGIYNNGTLNIKNSILRNNVSGLMGGAIFSYGSFSLLNSVVSDNQAGTSGSGGGGGGAIQNYLGTATIENSTISGNTLGAGFNGSAINNFGTMIIKNSTVAENSGSPIVIASEVLLLTHVTISNNSGVGVATNQLTLENSILANNSNGDCNVYGTLHNFGYNVIETNISCLALNTDIVGSDPVLAALANNGGQTQTMALLGNSPAINKIPPANCPLSSDQRGTIRPQGTNCDIGAYEATGAEPTATPSLTPTVTPTFTSTSTPTLTPTFTPTITPTPKFHTVINESFEKSFPRGLWKVYNGWGKSKCQKVSGTWSAWAVVKSNRTNCNKVYPNKSFNWMIYGPFNLSDAKKAMLKYNLWLNAELQKDVFFVGASLDGKRFYGKGYTGISGNTASTAAELALTDTMMPALNFIDGVDAEKADAVNASWVPMKFNLKKVPTLGNLAGKGRVYIGFLWYSDAQNGLKGGAFVDDVLLTKVKR